MASHRRQNRFALRAPLNRNQFTIQTVLIAVLIADKWIQRYNRDDSCADTSNPSSAVYLLGPNNRNLQIIPNSKSSVGLGWNKKKKLLFYYLDSCFPAIREFYWSSSSGLIGINNFFSIFSISINFEKHFFNKNIHSKSSLCIWLSNKSETNLCTIWNGHWLQGSFVCCAIQ